MYCWGDDMSGWERPEAYAYKGPAAARAARAAAKAASDQRGGRQYLKRREPDMSVVSPQGKVIETHSANPIVVAVDVTGSMAHWPFEIFDRLPLLYQTLSQYRPDVELCFAAIGDAHSDRFPLQVGRFARGLALEDQLGALYGEGGGGGGARESYELFAAFLLERARAPEAVRPLLIVFGDEGFYPEVDPRQATYHFGAGPAGEGARRRALDSAQVWRAVAEAWNVFHLRKPYGEAGGRADRQIQAQWEDVLGPERIIALDSAERAVDVALGLIARLWGHYEDFESNMGARQDAAKVRAVGQRLRGKEVLR